MRGILDAVSPAATLVEALEPIRSDPGDAAVLLDIDGTLAPIVRHAADAHVPEATRTLLNDPSTRAIPKSTSLTAPPAVTKMLDGLRSR